MMTTAPGVHAPRTLEAALELLADAPPELRLVAGGTDIMVMLHAGVVRAGALLDLWKLDELRGIALEDGALVLGALTTYTDLVASPLVRHRLPVLAEIAATIGAIQIQNRGTIGGNLCNASPAADMVPAFSALDGEIDLASRRGGARRVSIHDFFLGYRQTCLRPDELLVRVRLPLPAPDERVLYRKVGTRRAQAISKIVLVAAVAGPRLRAAAGSVAPTVVRLRSAETAFAAAGGRPGEPDLRAAILRDIAPIDDIRSTAHYRRRVTGNILCRMLIGKGS